MAVSRSRKPKAEPPAETPRPNEDAPTFACAAARIAASSKAEDVSVLDLRGLSNVADLFVLATGTSDRQMRAILHEIEEHARTVGRKPFATADRGGTTWLLADYVDVVIHLFDEEHREYYDLDDLWGDAPRLEWQEEAGP